METQSRTNNVYNNNVHESKVDKSERIEFDNDVNRIFVEMLVLLNDTTKGDKSTKATTNEREILQEESKTEYETIVTNLPQELLEEHDDNDNEDEKDDISLSFQPVSLSPSSSIDSSIHLPLLDISQEGQRRLPIVKYACDDDVEYINSFIDHEEYFETENNGPNWIIPQAECQLLHETHDEHMEATVHKGNVKRIVATPIATKNRSNSVFQSTIGKLRRTIARNKE